ncbi:glycoside hydrolase family 3 N-terminal domain-containing protein [Micropruina sp.]|uniref:glycoside hydrolase family 3 N-terminal domain-containing protein n=1 Tax=Micropruina sp. TaxID=2737536 RepID=UPI0039E3E63E
MRRAAALVAIGLLAACTPAPSPTAPAPITSPTAMAPSPTSTSSASAPSSRSCATAIVDDLSLAERAGQLVMVGVSSASPSELAVLKAHKIGSVILLGQHADGVSGVRKLTARLAWKGQKLPLLVAVDQEGGLVQRLKGKGFDTMPSAEVQAGWSNAVLRAKATRWGRQLAAAGVTWTLAPVADVVPGTMAARNRPIGALNRGYGSSPATVRGKVTAFIRGMSEAGVATSAKHFPGIGRVVGNTDFTAGVKDTLTTADDPYLLPFEGAVEANVPSIMVSTVTYTRIDAKKPAVFSAAVVGLLRSTLHFDGVVISDDLGAARSMAAVPARQRGIGFVKAGGDIAITVAPARATAFVGGIVTAAKGSEVVAGQVRQAAIRVLTMKIEQGLVPCR